MKSSIKQDHQAPDGCNFALSEKGKIKTCCPGINSGHLDLTDW